MLRAPGPHPPGPGTAEIMAIAQERRTRAGQRHSRAAGGRLGQAEEIARGVAFLASEEAGFVTGSTMRINGGQHMY